LLGGNPHGGEHLKDLLVGQILWVEPARLVPVAALYAFVLAVWFTLGRRIDGIVFYLLFAITVTASVQLVGVYLVFASLIVPALATLRVGRHRLWLGYGLGALGYAGGLLASALFDLPTGPVIVCAIALVSALFAAFASNRAHRRKSSEAAGR
jgi:zinc/manganese transport system permease protein